MTGLYLRDLCIGAFIHGSFCSRVQRLIFRCNNSETRFGFPGCFLYRLFERLANDRYLRCIHKSALLLTQIGCKTSVKFLMIEIYVSKRVRICEARFRRRRRGCYPFAGAFSPVGHKGRHIYQRCNLGIMLRVLLR